MGVEVVIEKGHVPVVVAASAEGRVGEVVSAEEKVLVVVVAACGRVHVNGTDGKAAVARV